MLETLRKNKKITNICVYLLILMLCVVILQPLFEIAQYNRPSADDYDYGIRPYMALKNGGGLIALIKAAWAMVVYAYNTFSGLYTSAFILALHPGVWGENMYPLCTWVIFAVIFFFSFWSVYILNKHFVKRSLLFVVTATFALLTMLVLWLPSAWQALYWYNGSMNYMPYVFMNFMNLCLLIEMDSAMQTTRGKVLLAVSMVLSFLISGGNHVTSFANILMLLFVAVYKSTKKQFHVFLPLLVACIGFAIMYFSPGTQMRQHIFATKDSARGAIETIIATVKHWIYIFGDWVSVTWLLSLAAITPISIEIVKNNPRICPRYFPAIPILLSAAVISGMFCVPYMAMGEFGEGRVTNVIWITFMVLSWTNYVLVWGWMHRNGYVNLERITQNKYAGLLGALVVCVCLFVLYRCHDDTMSVSMQAVHEIKTGIAESYAMQMDDRIARYKDPSLKEVAVTSIENPSELLFWGEFTEDPEEWPNAIMGEWYGGKSIYLIPDGNQDQ